MFRKIVDVSLFVSFIAMSTSGLMMFFINKISFTLQMQPVHKFFGLVLVVSAIAHIVVNSRDLINHLKKSSVAMFGAGLVALLVFLYGVVIDRTLPQDVATQLNELSKYAVLQVESKNNVK